MTDHSEEDSLPKRHRLPNNLPHLASFCAVLDDVTELQRGDRVVDNYLAHALCQESRAHSRDATPKQYDQCHPQHRSVRLSWHATITVCSEAGPWITPANPRFCQLLGDFRPRVNILFDFMPSYQAEISRRVLNEQFVQLHACGVYEQVRGFYASHSMVAGHAPFIRL